MQYYFPWKTFTRLYILSLPQPAVSWKLTQDDEKFALLMQPFTHTDRSLVHSLYILLHSGPSCPVYTAICTLSIVKSRHSIIIPFLQTEAHSPRDSVMCMRCHCLVNGPYVSSLTHISTQNILLNL